MNHSGFYISNGYQIRGGLWVQQLHIGYFTRSQHRIPYNLVSIWNSRWVCDWSLYKLQILFIQILLHGFRPLSIASICNSSLCCLKSFFDTRRTIVSPWVMKANLLFLRDFLKARKHFSNNVFAYTYSSSAITNAFLEQRIREESRETIRRWLLIFVVSWDN